MVSDILQLLRENQFDTAIPRVTEALRSAAAKSAQELADVARKVVAYRGFFKNTAEAKTSESYFRTVHDLLADLLGPESPETLAAAENLAGLLGSIDKLDEAIVLRERVLAHLTARLSNDAPRLTTVRDGLSILYQRGGYEEKLKELYKDTGLCEHLRAAEHYVRDQGGRVVSTGRPWSDRCHIWVYFDTLLDCDRLIQGLRLDPCVQIHEHRGTHDGSERGIVCTIHHDGIMGPHPLDAPPSAKPGIR